MFLVLLAKVKLCFRYCHVMGSSGKDVMQGLEGTNMYVHMITVLSVLNDILLHY